MESRMNQFDKAVRMRKESTEAILDYWKDFSIFTTFEFWFMVMLFLGPLIFLIFKIDKRKIFLIGFFGYSVHVFNFYINLLGVNMGMWNYPIQVFPAIPSLSLDASLVPITYMFVYQWTLNHKKNYYLFAIITAMIFSFVFEPLLVQMGLFKIYGNINYIHRLISYVVVSMISKLITNLFLKLQKISKF